MHEKEDYDDSLLKETVDNLLSGLSEDEAFKSITITDVTDDVRLINCYRNCNFTDLFSFLKLGRKRMKLRGYGRTSEVRLNLSLTNFLKCNDGIVQENLANMPLGDLQSLIEELRKGVPAKDIISVLAWLKICKGLKEKNREYADQKILKIALVLNMSWPLGKSELKDSYIFDFIDLSISDLLKIPTIGKKKVNTYVASVLYLYDLEAPRIHENLEGAVESVFGSDSIDAKEREIILLRYGLRGKRKHTLDEIAQAFEISRERVRQIIKKSVIKFELNSNFKNLSSLLLERKNEIWNQLTSEHMLKKGICKEESLKHALDFNYQFVIELTNLKRYDSVNDSSLYTWLSENFLSDEIYFYEDHKLDNLINETDRTLLKELSTLTENYLLCDFCHRQNLLLASQYDALYVSSIPVFCKLFKEVYIEIEDLVDESKRMQLKEIIDKLSGGFKSDEHIRSYHLHSTGLMDSESIFFYAESLIGGENQEFAHKLMRELESKFGPDHPAILSIKKQVQ